MPSPTVRSLLTEAIDQAETLIDTLDMAHQLAQRIGLVPFRTASITAAINDANHAIAEMHTVTRALAIPPRHPPP